MGFIAGLGLPSGLGVPSYYMDDPSNVWDKDTYAFLYLDNSGSMDDLIQPLTDALMGDYFSSGDAVHQNGVKNENSLRGTLQDIYATGGIEGAPDWNTNSATNGADEYDKHVSVANLNPTANERTVYALGHPLKTVSGTTSYTTFSDTYFVTPSNFVFITVCNESSSVYHDFNFHEDSDSPTLTYQTDITYLRDALKENGLIDNRADNATPSYTAIMIDPAYNGSSAETDSQRFARTAIIGGEGNFSADNATIGDINEPDGFASWNLKDNLIGYHPIMGPATYQTPANGGVNEASYWRDVIVSQLQQNMSIPGY